MICEQPAVPFIISLIVATLGFATPLTLGALCGLFCERSGIVNIAIEGLMLTAAFVGFVASSLSHSVWLGLLFAVLAAVLMSALHALLSIRFSVDQIISGTVVNILAIGITGYFNSVLVGAHSLPDPPGTFSQIGFTVPRDIAVIGGSDFKLPPLAILAVILVFVAQYVLFNTSWGLRTRAVGENPEAADTVGINVYFMRYSNVLIGGTLAGLAGAYFTLESTSTFENGMTAGKGFIALAALIFGKWRPFGLWGAALLFGFAQALTITVQFLQQSVDSCKFGIPRDLLVVLPYILTILVVAGVVGRSIPPAAVGQPYRKGR